MSNKQDDKNMIQKSININKLYSELYDCFSDMKEMSEKLNSNMLLTYIALTEGDVAVSDAGWSLCDLHSKTYELRDKITFTFEKYLEQMKIIEQVL